MTDKTNRPGNSRTHTIIVILAVFGGIFLIGAACVALMGLAGAGYYFTAGSEADSGGGQVINGSDPSDGWTGARPIQVGESAPDFTLQSVDGATHTLGDYRGQIVFINFWATWCPTCESEMPAIETAYETYESEGFVVLGINVGDPSGPILDFQDEESLTFPLLMDSDGAVADSYSVLAFPTSVLVDQGGIIQRVYYGPVSSVTLETDIEALLR